MAYWICAEKIILIFMPLFKYKAVNKDGKEIDGQMSAKDKFELYHLLKNSGETVVSAEETREGGGKFSIDDLFAIFGVGGVKTHDKIIMARNLGQMVLAGLPITRGLSIMERQAKKGKLKDVLKNLSDSIAKGGTLSDAMKGYPKVFSALFVSMVRAGEESGNLAMALQTVASQMEKTYQLNRKIRGAMMYPAVIISLMVVIGILMMVYMVPMLTSTFQGLGVQLPLSTRFLIGTSDFLKAYFVLVVIGLIFSIGLFMATLRTTRGQKYFDFLLLRLPIVGGIVKQVNTARTARTLSSLLSSGVDIVMAIDVTTDVLQNFYYKQIMGEVKKTVQKGAPISAVFTDNENLYPLFVGEMVSVGEETGKIGDMLLSVATFYEDEVDQQTKDMSSVIEPVIMIVIGIAVGFFAISVLTPMYSLANVL
jgi:type IV pilus assembly protein PilC